MLASAQVVAAIAVRLRGLPLAGERVFTSRAWPLAEKDLPAWRVQAGDEAIELLTVHPAGPQQHTLEVQLHGICRAVADLDDVMHALASEAITALFNDPSAPDALSQLAGRVPLSQSAIARELQGEGEATLGCITVTLIARFNTRGSAPDTIL